MDSVKVSGAATDAGGIKKAKLYIRCTSYIVDVFGTFSDKEFVHTLKDIISKQGAMESLISDCAKVKSSGRVGDVLRFYKIRDWQSEPYFQHQKLAERGYGNIKARIIVIMNASCAGANELLLILNYAIYIYKCMVQKSLGWKCHSKH